MDQMIDNMILIGLPEIALKMKWVELMFDQTEDTDTVFEKLFKLQKESI